MENLKIRSTVQPPEPLEQNEWMNEFNISTRFDPNDINHEVGFSTIYRISKTPTIERPLFNPDRFISMLDRHKIFSN
jgi:hypothetical protein